MPALAPFLFDLDNLPVLEFTVLSRDGTPYNITGATVTLLVEGVGEFACVVTDGAAGECTRTVVLGDFPAPGRYRAQLRVFGSGTFHTDIFIIQVSQAINSTNTFPVPPTLSPAVGGILFGAPGGQIGQDLSNLFWVDATNILQLFGGAAGPGAANLITLGQGTGPSSSPANSVELWGADVDGGGTTALVVRGEHPDFGVVVVDDTRKTAIGAGSIGTISATDLVLYAANAGTNQLSLTAGGNWLLGSAAASGTSAVRVLSLANGTAPTTFPSGTVHAWAENTDDSSLGRWIFAGEAGITHAIGRTVKVTMGSSTGKAFVGGTKGANFSTIGTGANTNETVLHTFTSDANALSVDGQGYTFIFQGAVAANANNKTIRLKIGGTGGTLIIDSGTIATNNADWRIEGTLVRTDSANISVEAQCIVGPAGAAPGAVSVHRYNRQAVAVTFSSGFTIDVTGLNGTASANDITATYSRLRYEAL